MTAELSSVSPEVCLGIVVAAIQPQHVLNAGYDNEYFLEKNWQ
jgi:hypothetical protein